MSTLFGDETVQEAQGINENGLEENKEKEGSGDPEATEQQPKRPAWLKQKKGGGKKGGNKKPNKQVNKPTTNPPPSNKVTKVDSSPAPPAKKPKDLSNKEENNIKKERDDSEDESDIGSEGETNETNDRSSEDDVKSSSVEDDDQEWEKFQQKMHKREKVLEGRSKISHTVHCPLFPNDKQEYWWTYVCDRKSRTLLTAPYHITSLVDQEECQLKFTAPNWKGVYNFTVCLRSDSYIGFDQQKDIKLDVKEAPNVPPVHPQWEFEDSEEEGPAEDAHDSEYATDEDIPEEE